MQNHFLRDFKFLMSSSRRWLLHWRSGLIIALVVVTGCGAPEPGGAGAATTGNSGEETTIAISGAFALFPMVSLWTEEYAALHPNVRFDIQAGGAGKGMTDVLTGAVDVAMLSREARPEEITQGAYMMPVTIDAVIGTFNANNPYADEIRSQGITPEKAAAMWLTGDSTTWDDWLGNGAAEAINVYTRSDASGAGEMWAKFSGGEAQEELLGTAVNADPGLAEAVRQDTFGIGYNNIGFAYDPTTLEPIEGLGIIPIDLNGDGQIGEDEDFYHNRDALTTAIAAQVYPFPPARELYLVTKGEPSEAIRDFLLWILHDGQGYVGEAGYVSLTPERLAEGLSMLGER
jgi:phosphate transport system substrate-binding protein